MLLSFDALARPIGSSIDFVIASCSCCSTDIALFVSSPLLDEEGTAAMELEVDDVALSAT